MACESAQKTITPQGQEPRLRLYLVRHGESQANEQGVFAGQLDSPLTERGVVDAKSLGERSEFLIFQTPTQSQAQEFSSNRSERQSYRFDAVYSSDLIRAHDTCKLILEGMQTNTLNNLDSRTKDSSGTSPLCTIRLDHRLRERSYGTLQGMPWSSDRSETDKMWRDTHEKDELPPIFETDDDIWIRVKKFLLDLIKDELSPVAKNEISTKHILITSHGGVLRQILMRLIGVDKLKTMGAEFDKKRKNRLITPNTSMTILDLSFLPDHQILTSAAKGEEANSFASCDSNLEDGNIDSLKGIQTEIILFANIDHLNDGVRIHDD